MLLHEITIHAKLIIEFLILTHLISFSVGVFLIFFERRNPTVTWAWLMILLFFPVGGFILFIFFGQNLRRNKRMRLKIDKDKFQRKAWQQEQKLENNNMVFNDPEVENYQDLIQLNLVSNEALFTQDNEVEVYTEGKQKFDSLLECFRNAKKYIHVEYYIFRSDNIGKQILRILEQKASEGVEVKLLYDAIGGINLSSYFLTKLKKSGGQVASFYPSFLYYINLRINYRNHRKIAIIDGEEAFVGGFNVGDEYLGLSKKFGFWRDTHFKIKGNAINGLQRQFLLDWKFASKEPLKFAEKEYFPNRFAKGTTGLQIVASGPDSKWTSIKDGYFKIITSARNNVYLQTPYLIPDESIFQALKVASLAGKDVRLIIPDKPDQMFVYWASHSYMGDLLEAGVRCYHYNRGFIHSKMLVADGIIGSVGTANLDIRSFQLNFEINAFVFDKTVAKKLEDSFIEDLKYCTEMTLERYNNRPRVTRFKESASRLLSSLL